MQLSTLVTILAVLLFATTIEHPSELWDRRTLSEIYRDTKDRKLRATTAYTQIVRHVSLALLIAGDYLAFTGR